MCHRSAYIALGLGIHMRSAVACVSFYTALPFALVAFVEGPAPAGGCAAQNFLPLHLHRVGLQRGAPKVLGQNGTQVFCCHLRRIQYSRRGPSTPTGRKPTSPGYTMLVFTYGCLFPAVAAPLAFLRWFESAFCGVAMLTEPVVLHAARASFPHIEAAQVHAPVGTWVRAASNFLVPSPAKLRTVGQLLEEVLRRLERAI